jgi:hypothetical protein
MMTFHEFLLRKGDFFLMADHSALPRLQPFSALSPLSKAPKPTQQIWQPRGPLFRLPRLKATP